MRRRWLVIIGLCLLVPAAGVIWHIAGEPATAGQSKSQKPQQQAVPATLGTAAKKDVSIFLSALGTVQAFNTVTVNTRVDGQLNSVNFKEGQHVNAGDVLAQIDPRPFKATLDLARATKAKDQANLENAQLDLRRFQEGGTLANTQQQIDTQGALVRQLQATVEADQANLDSAQVQLDYTTIRAPITGRAGIRLVDQGNIVHATDTGGLVVITQLQPISVVFTLPQDQLREVTQEMNASKTPLKVIAQGRTDGQTLDEGTLALVDNRIDQTTGSVKLKATFPNKDYKLWPGQYINVELQLETLPQVVTVPSDAVQRGPDGLYVYVVKPDQTASIQPVSVGQMRDGTAVIEKGLDAGTPIVVAGQYRVQQGSKIRNTADSSSATSADGARKG
ncbi:MAG TPA: efflux RND transporter periplasmic adaptor subunit [Bradyrhizobium sp.]|jgi:multidrug efflux system membrane fusion protein